MGGLRRLMVVLLGAAVVVQAVALCGATGWRAFTRYPSAEIAKANEDEGLSRLFEGSGLNDQHGTIAGVENRFAFGWLPSPVIGREAISVATVGGAGVVLVLIGVWPARGRHARRRWG